MELVRATALTRTYRLGRVAVPGLRGVDLSVSRGEILAITGPSGCGKSTLLHLLGGLDRPTGGELEVGGVDLVRAPERARVGLRRELVGFVFQRFNLLPTLTALGNLELAARIKRLRGAPAQPRALSVLLDRVGVGAKASARPAEMSMGEQQRVAIARALVGSPPLLLADEPTGSLDSENARRVLDLLAELNHALGQTIVLVTHAPEAAASAGRTVSMRDGRIIE